MRRYQVYTMFVQDESQSWTTREYSYFVENSSQTVSPLHDTPSWTRDGCLLLPSRISGDPQIAEIAILPLLMSSKGKLKLEGRCGSSADETSAQWSTGRMQILGRHNRKRATKACRSNSGDMTERALSKYPFRNRWKGISIALVWEVKTLRLSMQEYTMLGKRVIRFGGIEVANNNWNEVIRRARINQIKIPGIYKCFNKWLIEVTLFLKIFNWLFFQLGLMPKSDRCVRVKYSW